MFANKEVVTKDRNWPSAAVGRILQCLRPAPVARPARAQRGWRRPCACKTPKMVQRWTEGQTSPVDDSLVAVEAAVPSSVKKFHPQ